ncbi:6-hydroxymethylpterin diphosphokinase MptE-like protein [Halobacteriota archaeon]
MKFKEWNPIYQEILDDFGFDRSKDEEAALLLSKLIGDRSINIHRLSDLICRKQVTICGNAPLLYEELSSTDISGRVIIAADGATSVLLKNYIVPDIVVTDLDGCMEDIISVDQKCAIIVVHAHGDNIPAIKKYVPTLKNVIGSTQSKPIKNVHNFGGFTDGDRCVFLAKEFNADSIELIGFDFKDPNVSEVKKKKLQWTKRLIKMCDF